jgi:uncharacterized cupin superfamily protein
MPKINVSAVPEQIGTRYPAPYDEPCKTRGVRRLGDATGLTQFGVNLVRIPPGAWSSQRHWHSHEEEFVHVVSGDVILVTDAGEEALGPGDCVGFKAGDRDGHHFQNRSAGEVVLFVVGTRKGEDSGEYPDIDLAFDGNRYAGKGSYRHKDGTPY